MGKLKAKKVLCRGLVVVTSHDSAFLVPGSEPSQLDAGKLQKEVLAEEELEQTLKVNVGPGPFTM